MNNDLFATLLDAATVAAGRILRTRNRYQEIDLDLFAAVARPVYRNASERILGEWTEAVQAIVSDEALRQFVEAQALELGQQVADAYHDEMVWAS